MRETRRIILEGADGSGKSTLIEALRYRFHNLEVVRNELGPNQDFLKWWPEQLDREESPLIPIHDRFFYSELVYGPILRGKLAVEGPIIGNISWFLRSSSMLIYARPPLSVVRKHSHDRKQMEGVHDQLSQIYELYDQIMGSEMSWYGDRFVYYDWTREGDLGKVEAAVEKYLGETP